jgi:hypothetical protein
VHQSKHGQQMLLVLVAQVLPQQTQLMEQLQLRSV